MGEVLGNKVGRVIEVDCSANSIAWGRCLRVRILINVTKPLVRGMKVEFNGNTSVVIFRYEKLCDFYFICGKLDHVERDCLNLFTTDSEIARELRQFDPWLRANGLKGVSVEELSRGTKNQGKQRMDGQKDLMMDKMEVVGGEEFAIQVLQFDGEP